jgi:Tol biopolymer transport system component
MDQTHKPGPQARFGIFEAAIALALATLLLAIGGAVGYRFLRPGRKPAAPPMRVVPFTSFPGYQGNARFSPDGNQIAFTWYGDKDYNTDIYVKQIGAEKALRLTTDPAKDDSPTWSPDGRYVAFRRQGKRKDAIYVIPALGGLERKLLTSNGSRFDDSSMDWSPDGKYLAYVERGPRQSEAIFLLAVDNPKDKRALTASVGQWDYFPRFSPDGQTVAFVRFLDVRDIFLVRTAGGEPKRLTFDDAVIFGLDWTPDGAYIIFFSDRLGGSVRPWKIPASGGQPEPLSMPPGVVEEPSLSRDGRRLAYTQREFNANIWRYEVAPTPGRSAPPTKVIASTGVNDAPQFSPDGKRVAFVSSRSGSLEIWVCDSDGSNPRQLTFLGHANAGIPRWSPDGSEIVLSARAEGPAYIVRAEGGRPRRLTTDASKVAAPSWSRDGKWIYFGSDRSGAWQVWKVPPEGGQAVQVTRKGGYAALESLDGKTLYYAKRLKFPGYRKVQGLWKVPVEGGEETRVLKELEAGLYDCWGLTGEGIYFYNDHTNAIDFFGFATRRITQIAKPERRGGPLALSPDGRWILFDQVDLDTSHIMLVEDFRW